MLNGDYLSNNGCFGLNMFGNGWYFLIIGGIILVALATIYLYKRKNTRIKSENNAIEILKTKLIQGEITKKEYLEKKKLIEQK